MADCEVAENGGSTSHPITTKEPNNTISVPEILLPNDDDHEDEDGGIREEEDDDEGGGRKVKLVRLAFKFSFFIYVFIILHPMFLINFTTTSLIYNLDLNFAL